MSTADKILEIRTKAKEKGIYILSHTYQPAELQMAADFVADSLQLARVSKGCAAKTIVLCGVHFMAESAYILAPDKKVLLPRKDAGCPMADMGDKEKLAKMQEMHPNAMTVTYVNSSAEIKAMSDVCCTSANALEVVKNVPSDEIIFVPDKYLGGWVASQLDEKRLYLYDGYCPVHQKFSADNIDALQEEHPDAITLCHPEAHQMIRRYADKVMSTSQMIKFAEESSEGEFIILTETGIAHQLKSRCPDKKFYYPNKEAVCVNMKKTTLDDLAAAVDEERYEVHVDEELRVKAEAALERMLQYG